MPFTVGHVVAVLPFTARPLRRWFDPTALVIGAMVPDLPLFWPDALKYSWTHDLPFGPATYDLALGLAVYLAWNLVLRRPLGDLAPGPLRRRLPVLDAMLGPLPLYKWLQFGSGAFGLIVVGWWLVRWWLVRWWRRTAKRPVPATASQTMRRLSWLAVVGALGLVAVVVGVVGMARGLTVERIAFQAVTRGGAAAMIAVTICCLVWWIASRARRRADPR